MIFVINNLKYDTDKMELISDKCEYTFDVLIFGVSIKYYGKNVKLWKSKKIIGFLHTIATFVLVVVLLYCLRMLLNSY